VKKISKKRLKKEIFERIFNGVENLNFKVDEKLNREIF